MAIDGDAGQNRLISYRTGAVQRFGLYVNNTAESGSNAGSDFAIRAYSDAGTLLSTPFFIQRSTSNVGFGTTTPTNAVSIERTTGNSVLSLQGNAGTFISVSRFSDNAARPRLELYKSRGTIATPAVVQTNDELGSIDFYAYDGSANQRVGILYVTAESVVGSTITAQMAFGLGTSGPTNQYRMVIKNDGNITIGNSLTTLGARLGIKGSGSTSATTSLLVQNSSASDLFKITDNGQVSIPPINASSIANLVINAGLLGNSTAVGIDLVGGQYSAQFYLRALGAFTAGYPSAILGKVLFQAPSGLVITSNGAGALTNTDIAVYVYSSKSVHINGFTEVASAILNAESTTKGFLPPRMTTAQKNLIATPAIGLQIFDTDLNRPCFYNGAWVTL